MQPTSRDKSRQGFTLIEMLVIAPIVILAIGAFLAVILNLTGEVILSRASNNLAYDTQDTLSRIEQDVKQSAAFLSTNSFTVVTPQGSGNNTTKFTNIGGANGASLILNMVATTLNPTQTGSRYVYLKDQPRTCAQAQDNTPLSYNVVYFIDSSGTLWRRVIMPTDYLTSGCSTPWQQPSCAVGYSVTFCKTNDIKLISGVTNLTIDYYNGASATSANTVASTESDAALRTTAMYSATTVQVTVEASQDAAGRTASRSATLRATRLDVNASSLAQP